MTAPTVVKLVSGDGPWAGSPAIYCPACRHAHIFHKAGVRADGASWSWNGDMMRPTFSPSMKEFDPKTQEVFCHSIVKDGMIEFGPDSPNLAEQTVELPPFPEDYGI